ncbi:hypothetical protein ACM14_04140 [Delftia sp. JD2]|nr:hypothetical protein ACM14_04140 [Delftia sp. JD2]
MHFVIIFLVAVDASFRCPAADMNIYFAFAVFGKPIRYVVQAVLPAMVAIFIGTVLIAMVPALSTALPVWLMASAGRLVP